jgi:hypothetical protein
MDLMACTVPDLVGLHCSLTPLIELELSAHLPYCGTNGGRTVVQNDMLFNITGDCATNSSDQFSSNEILNMVKGHTKNYNAISEKPLPTLN